ncbi:cytosolic 5'-nucleotidase 1B isoform X2 [Parambassis ranga]|uniref:Cytosolic 5'-nucleotidase 1B isoform X2 n=1 Tax=Parambassis ranga TaxID=210632 RepID=A0A6P7KBJ1_9TELE|nr:cytosolic 5'-nucleotidase 1B-like isoform X2 [Parambassis ranga]
MVSTVQNTDVKQKDADRAVVVAVTAGAAFDTGVEDDNGVYRAGVAFPLLQALQKVNERLLEENPDESLLFDVVLITTDSQQQQQQSSGIMSSTRHYGLEVSRFCFSSDEDFVESLLKNKVHLFLTADRSEVVQASRSGVLSALLDEHTASCPSEQLRVLLCGDAIIQPDVGLTPASRQITPVEEEEMPRPPFLQQLPSDALRPAKRWNPSRRSSVSLWASTQAGAVSSSSHSKLIHQQRAHIKNHLITFRP